MPEDHPRVCGEKSPFLLRRSKPLGSPPRVRGKANTFHIISINEGITPACAGKSIPDICIGYTAQDHPRVCGEKASLFFSVVV